ncbi:MAG: hypothetical protein ABWZ25_18515 [Chitinophagaceae bacterium]
MITQYEVSSLLRKELPQLDRKLACTPTSLEGYVFMNYFADFTKTVVNEHRFTLARKCFQIAERLFRNGDAQVRRMIENIFIFSFSSFMPVGREERRTVRSIIPMDLYAVYLKQVMQTGS